jgi:uncharacterized repeat protein (TIGR01451 family)
MHLRFTRAALVAACGLLAVFLALPAAAAANHVNAEKSSATCALVNGIPTVTFRVKFDSFADANKPVSGTITLDGAVVKTYAGATAFTWAGSDFTLVFSQATTAGSHVLRGDFTWPGKTAKDDGRVKKTVECPAPASTIGITVDKAAVETTAVAGTTVNFTIAVRNTGNTSFVQYTFSDPSCTTVARTGANAGDTAFDPGDVWTYACTMATQAGQTSADNTATATGKNAEGKSATDSGSASIPLTQPATTPGGVTPGGTTPGGTTPGGTTPGGTTPTPEGGILPDSIASGRAQLRGPSGCVKGFRARVTGRSIASVAFFVDGKLVKRITDRRATYTVKLNARRYGFGRHRMVARVRFVAASGTAPRTLRLTFRRCAQDAVAPRFTG